MAKVGTLCQACDDLPPNSGGTSSDGRISPATRSPARRQLFSVSLAATELPGSRKFAPWSPKRPQIPLGLAPTTRHTSTATNNVPTTVPHQLSAFWRPERSYHVPKTRIQHFEHFAGHNNALRRLHDAPENAPHANTAEVSAARTIDAVEGTGNTHSESGVFRFQTGDCRVLRDGGARSAHGPDRDQH